MTSKKNVLSWFFLHIFHAGLPRKEESLRALLGVTGPLGTAWATCPEPLGTAPQNRQLSFMAREIRMIKI